MMTVDGSGAEPAGTYRPTLPMGRVMRSLRELRFVELGDVGHRTLQRRDLARIQRRARRTELRSADAKVAQ
jgi:hypothetical protein